VGPSAVLLTGSTSSPNVSIASVLLVCSNSAALAIPAVTVDGTETNGTQTVHAGDLMKATVTKSGKGAASFEELIVDTKVGQGATVFPVANFGKISYSNGAVSGKALGSVKPSVAVNMVNSKKVVQILTGPLSGAKKNAFTTTFKHS